MYLNKSSNADNHSVKVLTRSKSQAQSIFPGKKVIVTSLVFQEVQQLDICLHLVISHVLPGQIVA